MWRRWCWCLCCRSCGFRGGVGLGEKEKKGGKGGKGASMRKIDGDREREDEVIEGIG